MNCMPRKHIKNLASLSFTVTILVGCNGARPDVPSPSWRHVKTNEVKLLPNESYQDAWQDFSRRFGTSIHWEMPAGILHSCKADGTYLPLNDDQDMVLMVLLPRSDSNDQPPVVRADHQNADARARPVMRLAVTSLVASLNDNEEIISILPQVYVDPPIECDLDAAQAQWVQQNGIPQSLVNEMHSAAKAANCKPISPSGTTVYPGPAIIVDPKSHFQN